jgi:hypothetical protein
VNGVYYTAEFSTLLRALGGARLDAKIEAVDTRAGYPLPRYVGRAKLRFRAEGEVEQERSGYQVVEIEDCREDRDRRAQGDK